MSPVRGESRSAIKAITMAMVSGETTITNQILRLSLAPIITQLKIDTSASKIHTAFGTRFSSVASRFSLKSIDSFRDWINIEVIGVGLCCPAATPYFHISS
jgi:hypothetical protein